MKVQMPKLKTTFFLAGLFGLFSLFCFSPLLQKTTSAAQLNSNTEGLQALSECMERKKAIMYGSRNCSHCTKQKEMFGKEFRRFQFVDCSSNKKRCRQAGVDIYPYWTFSNGKSIGRPKTGGELTFSDLARASGCQDFLATALTGSSAGGNKSQIFGTPSDLAQCLKRKGVIFFGSPKCSRCNKQKEMFQGAFEQYLSGNFHNCKGSSAEKKVCREKKTYPFPTWLEPSTGKKLVGPQRELDYIASYFDCDNISLEKQQPVMEEPKEVETTGEIFFERPAQQETTKLDLTAISNCLREKSVIFYGMMSLQGNALPSQVKSTEIQLRELGPLADLIKAELIQVVDCSLGPAECNGISVFPTWSLSQRELVGIYSSEELLEVVGCNRY